MTESDFLFGFIYVLLVIFIVLFTITACKWQDEYHNIIEIKKEYDILLEQYIWNCGELEKSEELVITQNGIIKNLKFNHATEFAEWLDNTEEITLKTYNFKTLYCHFRSVK